MRDFIAAARAEVHVVESVDEALAAIGAVVDPGLTDALSANKRA